MGRSVSRMSAIGLICAQLLVSSVTLALAQTSAREGNIWDWRDHQPTTAQIQAGEKAAGLAPSSSQRNANAAEVDRLYKQLLHDARS